MQGDLHALTYVSRAAADLSEDDVYNIYKAAMEYNSLDGVTGLLVFDGTWFMQIIEGGKDAIDAVLARMSRDSRHEDLDVVDRRQIATRSFADWSMRMVRVDRAHMKAIDSLEQELGPRVQPEIRTLLLQHAKQLDALA